MLVSLALSFQPVADRVGKATGAAAATIVYWAKTVFVVALGVWIVSSGIAALAVPVVGIALIAIGLVLITWAVWPIFNRDSLPDEGQKPK